MFNKWMLSLFLTLFFSSFRAMANDAKWDFVGKTLSDCEFSASFLKLKGYPFAKIEIDDSSAEVVP